MKESRGREKRGKRSERRERGRYRGDERDGMKREQTGERGESWWRGGEGRESG